MHYLSAPAALNKKVDSGWSGGHVANIRRALVEQALCRFSTSSWSLTIGNINNTESSFARKTSGEGNIVFTSCFKNGVLTDGQSDRRLETGSRGEQQCQNRGFAWHGIKANWASGLRVWHYWDDFFFVFAANSRTVQFVNSFTPTATLLLILATLRNPTLRRFASSMRL